ncbi:MAG: 2-hydroxyacyl-CoA dehydratase [Promethearchaeota archaeon]|nr:MAG: 2-hydroxyacyl-CoA dehydratase [Candidatus Lokiarchaeota archaeon]
MQSLELLSEFTTFIEQKKAQGKKIIAFIGHDNIPEELIDAAGFIPLRMIFAGDDSLMNASHNFLPPSTCSFAQSCIGFFSLKPNMYRFLDYVDYILLSNHCVSDIVVSEIICDNFNIDRINFYVSYTRNENALKYYKIELDLLRKELEKIKGETIPDEEIRRSIIKYNNFKKTISKVKDLNIKGSEKLKVYQKAMLFGPQIQPELEKFIKENKNRHQIQKNNAKPVILSGCSIFIGDYLIDMIEDGGGNIVFFDSWIGHNYYSQIISEKILEQVQDPMDLFVKRFENNIYGDHTVPDTLEEKLTFLENYINSFQKEYGKKLGVINHIIKFCDHFSLIQSTFKEKLQERGIQVLNLERDYSRSIRGQLTTRIEAFMEMI